MPFTSRTPTYLTPEQRHALIQIPADLSDREIARHYTFSRDDLDLINQRRRHHNRLGFAVQLAVLRFPGRPWKDLAGIPSRVLLAIADQVQVPASTFALYGKRDNTLYEHLDEIRRTYKFRECGWREYLWLARELLPLAMESDRPIPLIEQALELLRTEDIIAPVLTHLERLVWIVLKAAEKRLFHVLTASLTLEQRSRLDGLLHADAGRRGTARLIWLREPPSVTSAKSVKQIVERLLFLRGLDLPALPPTLHQNRVLQLARKCSKYQTQPLLKFKAERRHALLMAHLFELSQDLTDQALDQFDRLLGELMRKGERRQEKHFRLNARTLNSHLAVLTKATEAFLVARTEGEDPVTAVLAKVSETQLQATVDSAKRLLRPENLDSLDLIESRYTPMRQSLLSLYQALDFQPVRKSEPALQALEYVSQLAQRRKRVTAREQNVGKVKMTAPLAHLTERWRKHALNGDEIAPNYYEAAAFEALKGRVRSGDIAVDGSRRYRAFEGYLLSAPHFEQLAQKDQTRLAVTEKAEAYLTTKQQEIIGKLEALQESIGKVEGSLCLDDKGKLHLPALEKEIPAEVERLRLRVYDMLPQITLPDLLLELDNWTGFLRPLTHLTSGDAPVGDEKLVIVAALMGMGMNLGLTKMEQSCPYTYRQLSWSVDWHIREETLLASQACLDNFVLSAPLSHAWGDGTTSSSDGMRMSVGVKAANAEYNAKYFGVGRGTNIYVHAADVWMPFGKPQVIGTNEEALYVLDAVEPSEPLKTLLFEPVNKKLIMDQWEEMQRLASSIRHGTVSASLLMRKLAAYPRQNQVARALTEFGKLERTSFLLEYFRDEALRRRILIGLNKGEALHALARQLFFGRLGELRDRALEDQIHRASCLHLLIAAIAAWNTIYLTEAFATLRRQGEEISETTIAHIAPLGWEHINLIGKYQFAPQPGRSLENLRPLRLKVRTEGEKIPQEVVG